jgi:phosphoglycolate phosphatase
MPARIKEFDALIFDIDGTLWNASPACAKGWNLGLEQLGIDRRVTPEQIEKVSGHPYEQCIDILLPGLRAKIPELSDTLNQCETEAVRADGGEFFEGVLDGIRRLAEQYKIFLVSNCQEWYLELFLDLSALRPVLTGFDCHGLSGLPKNEMLLRLKDNQSLHYPAYIGDTAGDETAAKLSGMDFIHAAWGFGQPAAESTTVHSFSKLLRYLTPAATTEIDYRGAKRTPATLHTTAPDSYNQGTRRGSSQNN